MNDSQKNESTVKNDDQRPASRSVIGAIAVGALAATVGMTTACCAYSDSGVEEVSDGESN